MIRTIINEYHNPELTYGEWLSLHTHYETLRKYERWGIQKIFNCSADQLAEFERESLKQHFNEILSKRKGGKIE